VCRPLFIPNDIRLIAAVSGALLDLTKPYNWEVFGTVTPDEAASAMLTMLETYFTEACQTMLIGSIVFGMWAEPPPGTVLADGNDIPIGQYPDFDAVCDPEWELDTGYWTLPAIDSNRGIVGGSPLHTFASGYLAASGSGPVVFSRMMAVVVVGNAAP